MENEFDAETPSTSEERPAGGVTTVSVPGELSALTCRPAVFPPPALERSCVRRFDGASWDGVRAMAYKAEDGTFRGVTRRVLASPADAAFEVRYFELDPDGHSTFERHAHVHVVVCYRGRGRVRLGDEVHEIGFGDVVYIAPNEPHQFSNPYADPFGFLCIVDRERDRPTPAGG